MGDPFRNEVFPRGALHAAALLVFGAIALAAFGRYTGVGTTSMPAAAPVSTLEIRFLPLENGQVAVVEVGRGRVLAELPATDEGFIRGVLRGLERERTVARVPFDASYRLNRWSDGRMSITDPSTSRTIELDAFGPTNAASFARLFPESR